MWLTAVKWLGPIVVVLGILWGIYHLGAVSEGNRVTALWNADKVMWEELRTNLTEQKVQAQIAARKAEQAASKRITEISDQLNKQNAEAIQEREKIIADLRTGNLRLRERFRTTASCPGVPETASDPGGRDGKNDAGLTPEDEEFLVRGAARGDTAIRRLTACQNILRSIQ